MKTKRQRKIIELITNYNVETQEELANLLTENGFSVTQATISRDIRELNLIKTSANDGRQKYAVATGNTMTTGNKYKRVLSDGVIFMESAGNLLVLKTVSGMAMAVGAAIDAISIENIIGCIAGDDTVMCVVKDAEQVESVKMYLEEFMV